MILNITKEIIKEYESTSSNLLEIKETVEKIKKISKDEFENETFIINYNGSISKDIKEICKLNLSKYNETNFH